MSHTHPGGLTPDHVRWAYRILLDREPENEGVIAPKLAGSANTAELRNHLITSGEFREKNPDFAHTNTRTIVIVELDAQPPVRLFVDLADHVIGLGIVRGSFEPEEMAFVRSLLKPGDVVLDIGAHIGFFTMQMASLVGPEGRVYAFEPMNANADLLERSIAENRFGDRIEFRRGAVGAESGTARLTFPKETLNTGGAFLLAGADAPPSGHLEAGVPVLAIDDLALRHPVRFIKMDVEGAEPQVLRGALRLLQTDRPVILTEVHPSQLARASGVSAAEFFQQLSTLGYDVVDTIGAPLAPAEGDVPRTAILVPRA
jgi:FkbM family methyltransferase